MFCNKVQKLSDSPGGQTIGKNDGFFFRKKPDSSHSFYFFNSRQIITWNMVPEISILFLTSFRGCKWLFHKRTCLKNVIIFCSSQMVYWNMIGGQLHVGFRIFFYHEGRWATKYDFCKLNMVPRNPLIIYAVAIYVSSLGIW